MELQELSAVKQAVMRAYAGVANGMNSIKGLNLGAWRLNESFKC